MTRLPHPGGLTKQELANLDAVSYNNPVRYIEFEFDHTQKNKPKLVGRLPKNAMVLGVEPIRIESSFDGGDPFLHVGTRDDNESIGHAPLHVAKSIASFTGNSQKKMFAKLEKEEDVFVTVYETSPSTGGKGRGLIKYIDLGSVNVLRRK